MVAVGPTNDVVVIEVVEVVGERGAEEEPTVFALAVCDSNAPALAIRELHDLSDSVDETLPVLENGRDASAPPTPPLTAPTTTKIATITTIQNILLLSPHIVVFA